MKFQNAQKISILFLASLFIISSCGDTAMTGLNASSTDMDIPDGISGKVDNAKTKEIHLFRVIGTNKNELISSATLDEKNNFIFEESQLEPTKDFYYLTLDKRKTFSFMLDQEDDMFVHLNADDMETPIDLQGPNYLVKFSEFKQSTGDLDNQIAELNKSYVSTKDPNTKKSLQEEAMDLMSQKEDLAKAFIKEHKNHGMALGALENLSLSSEENLNLIDQVLKSNPDMSKTLMHRSLKSQMLEGKKNLMALKNHEKKQAEKKKAHMRRLANGVPEIAMDNPKGEQLKLSDLKGNVVLIDFWASWCGPCRRENPSVVAAYNKYNKDGFEIFSVSLDKDLTKWQAAIAQDGLVWPNHVSDLLGWQNKAAKTFNVHSVPHTVLLDRDGSAIDVMLKGKELEEKLEEIFGY